ncbi:MAG TPA: phage Gp37/Gp68 family protein [Longimicrobiales bacterium]|nr:phage Gp37/Gp68 family protein [Longimicrobiales bacterium]
MPQRTGIEWTELTWNPVTGCTRVSAGCDNCYAATLAHRLLNDSYCARLPVVDSDITRRDPFAVRLWPERLEHPLGWSTPRMIFVNSMSDVFHADIPEVFTRRLFEVMLEADWHTYQLLTKRPARAQRFLRRNRDLLPQGMLPSHVWIGASVENQEAAFRVRQLQAVPAAVRFLSCEPLIGPVDLDLDGIHWVIVGGESGPVRRPMNPEWVTAIRDRCMAKAVPFFFKQWGGRTPKAGGRELDGRHWDEMPMRAAGA